MFEADVGVGWPPLTVGGSVAPTSVSSAPLSSVRDSLGIFEDPVNLTSSRGAETVA